jgi:hypothetical protein
MHSFNPLICGDFQSALAAIMRKTFDAALAALLADPRAKVI